MRIPRHVVAPVCAALVLSACGFKKGPDLFAEDKQNATVDNTLTGGLQFEGGETVAGRAPGPDGGPTIESCWAPLSIAGDRQYLLRPAVPVSQAGDVVKLLWQFSNAEDHIEIPVQFDDQGQAGFKLDVVGELKFRITNAELSAVDSQGRVGEPLRLRIILAKKANENVPEYLTLQTEGHPTRAIAFSQSPDYDWLVTGGDDAKVKLWDLSTGQTLQTFDKHQEWVMDVAITRDGSRIVSASTDATVRLWDTETGELLLTIGDASDIVSSVALTADDKFFAAGSWDGMVRVYTLEGEPVATLDAGDVVNDVALSPDGSLVLAATGRLLAQGGVRGWSSAKWDMEFDEVTPREVTAIAVDVMLSTDPPTGRVAFASGRGTIYVKGTEGCKDDPCAFDPPDSLQVNGEGIVTDALPKDTIPSLDFVPEQPQLATVTLNGLLTIWNLEKGQIGVNLPTDLPALAVSFAPDRKRLGYAANGAAWLLKFSPAAVKSMQGPKDK